MGTTIVGPCSFVLMLPIGQHHEGSLVLMMRANIVSCVQLQSSKSEAQILIQNEL